MAVTMQSIKVDAIKFVWRHQNRSIARLATDLNVTTVEVKRLYDKAMVDFAGLPVMDGEPFTSEQKAVILQMREEGKMFKEIGEFLGRSQESVCNKYKRLQIQKAEGQELNKQE